MYMQFNKVLAKKISKKSFHLCYYDLNAPPEFGNEVRNLLVEGSVRFEGNGHEIVAAQ